MAKDEATFTVRLTDKVRGPASRAAKAVKGLANRFADSIQKTRAGAAATRVLGRAHGALSKRTEGLRKVFGKAGAVTARMRKALPGVARSAGKVSKRFLESTESGSKLTKLFKGGLMLGAAAAIGMLASKVAGLAQDIVGATVDAARLGEKMEFALGKANKNWGGANQMEHASLVARRLGLDLDETRSRYRDLASANVDTRTIDDFLKLGADLKAMGEGESIDGLIKSIGSIRTKGKFDAGGLRKVMGAGIEGEHIEAAFAKDLGVDAVNLEQALGKGIDADRAIGIIRDALLKKVGGAKPGDIGEEFANTTLDGLLNRIDAEKANLIAEVSKGIGDPAKKALGDALGKWVEFMSSDEGKKTIGDITRSLGIAVDLAVEFGKAFGDEFIEMMKPLGSLFGELSGNGEEATSVVRTLGKGLAWVAGSAVYLVGAIGAGLGAIAYLGVKVQEGIQWLGKVGWGLAKDLVNGLVEGIKSAAMAPVEAIKDMGKAVVGAWDSLFKSHSPSRLMMGKSDDIADGLTEQMRRREASVARAGARLGAANVGGIESTLDVGPVTSFAAPAEASSVNVGGGGFGPIRYSQTIQVDGAGADAEQVARIAARESRRETEAFFRELAMGT